MALSQTELATCVARLRSVMMRRADRWQNNSDHTWVTTTQTVLDRTVVMQHKNILVHDTHLRYSLRGHSWTADVVQNRKDRGDIEIRFEGDPEMLLRDVVLFRLMGASAS